MKKYSRVMARIDLDAITYNMEQMHRNIDAKTKMIGVVKTDGYGHGAIPVARMLEAYEYVWGFATATLDEAVLLRKSGIRKPILVLGCIFPDQFEEMLEHEIRMTVYQEEQMQELSDLAVQLDRQAYFHVKLETGMSRLGFAPTDDSVEAIRRIIDLPHMKAEGIFTHFAKADEEDKTYTRQQLTIFHEMTSKLKERGVTFPYEHCSNSAGIIDVREANCDLVRAGIAIYGLYPSQEVSKKAVELKPALSLISHVEYVKTISAGTSVSYGGTFVAEKEMQIATIPVGYGDGYPRSLSNKAYVLIHGKKAPIIGRVCMDQFMVDVTGIDNVKFGDQAVLIGTDGEETITVDQLSELADRFNYEFVCDLGKRIPRVYCRDGKIIEQIDYFA
ncbi:alanine racemase [Coprococcus sp. AF21-14LB]|uniref:alanine racemase n=1 Tax=Coprococcus sp. AF21-14LB TaxID=2292231 RepID=UPI000E5124C5|nr:alanine racemase [Coprococcus sp. AF21-14LB]RGS81705.1 alanine racemase [Coprococcus sp. AF21-14LB]